MNEVNHRTCRELSSSDKVTVIQRLQPFLKKDKLACGAFKHVVEQLSLDPRAVASTWRLFSTAGAMKYNKPGNVGPKPTHSPALIRQLVGAIIPVEQRSTYRDMAAATGLTLGTLSRHLKKGTLQRRSSRIKPLLTEANKAERLEFDSLWDVVYLHEKWFNADKDRRKFYLLPGKTPPQPSCKSKRFIPKVMFLAAVARPRFDEARGADFDGKTWRVCLPTAGRLRCVGCHLTDLNVLDFGFFASIQSLQYEKMSRTVDNEVRHTMEAFSELNYEKLADVFLTYQLVMRLVIEHNEDNKFALPHLKKAALRRAGLLMSNVACPVSLLS
ncbi:hypothetical protein DYB30_014406 [Aphanomyces astaci]|uniref:Transposase Tc1-like domain-containing protein n=1 Tax=Aphanomyces astaci TaxID=112090 RepID=A0A397ED81_APHAT|nr:hypothetical protein DYB30_014406 [Aphanomyces astaci]